MNDEGQQLASAIDLANSWAREIGVDECNDNQLRDLIDRIWSKASGLIYRQPEVPIQVRLALRVLLNHIEEPPSWRNCKTTVERWLEELK